MYKRQIASLACMIEWPKLAMWQTAHHFYRLFSHFFRIFFHLTFFFLVFFFYEDSLSSGDAQWSSMRELSLNFGENHVQTLTTVMSCDSCHVM